MAPKIFLTAIRPQNIALFNKDFIWTMSLSNSAFMAKNKIMKTFISTRSTYLVLIIMLSCAPSKFVKIKLPVFDKEGHRGCRGLLPENTIPAMIKAIDLGVTTLEMDLHISQDKKVVVSHDPYFNSLISTKPYGDTLTPNEGKKILIYSLSYDSIKKYDVGKRGNALFPRQVPMPVHKPLLSDLIESVEQYAATKNKQLFYNMEIKSTEAGDGKNHPPVEEFVDLAIKIIKEKKIEPRAIIQSFDMRALQVVHRKYPKIKTSFLIEAKDGRSLQKQLAELGFTPTIYSPHYSMVNKEMVNQCHNKKIKVIPWTVNSVAEIKNLIGLGVDGLISDYPNLFIEAGM